MAYYKITLVAKVEADNVDEAKEAVAKDFNMQALPSWVTLTGIEEY